MMANQIPLREPERENYAFFLDLPEVDRRLVKVDTVKGAQFLQPLFEYSGACAGCGETPYYKLLTQLFGDRAVISNATGCSSIYGGNLPTTPFTQNKDGRGPTWNNSLFEDNAEFGMGFRLTIDQQNAYAKVLLKKLGGKLPGDLVAGLLEADQKDEAGIYEQRERVVALKDALGKLGADADAKNLLTVADMLVKKSVWIVGGDGWAYDIGYGGLDHVHRQRPQRQRAGARHRGVLEHRRPVLEVDPDGRGGQVRGGRQADRQEGPGPDGHGLPQRLRRHRGHGLQRRADGARLHRGRGLRRPLDHHRVQPLHRPRHRHGQGPRPPDHGGRQRRVDALPLQPGRSTPRARTRSSSTPSRPS